MEEENKEQKEDWRESARKAGYEFIPSSDMKELKTSEKSLGEFRALLPEEFRSDPAKFFEKASSAFTALDDLQNKDKSELEVVQGETKGLKTQITRLTNDGEKKDGRIKELETENKSLNMWGLVGRAQIINNAVVDDTFIDEKVLMAFELDGYDLSKPESQKSLMEAVWKDILEPAVTRQDEVVNRVSGRNPQRVDRGSGDGDGGKGDDDKTVPTKWGSLA